MKDTGQRQEFCREFSYPIPRSAIPLTSLHKRASPEIDCVVPESPEAFAISRNRMIRKVSADDLSKPFSLDRYGFVHSPLQLLFDRSQLCPHPISARLPFKLEGAPAGSATDMSKTKKVERFRLSKTTAFSIFSRKAAEFNQPGLIRMQRKRELFQPLPHIFQEPFRVSFVLKAHDKVIGVPHYDDLTSGVVFTPVIGPKVERIVKIDIGQKRRCHGSLRSAHLGWYKVSIIHDARL
jgi:hypothetical protein